MIRPFTVEFPEAEIEDLRARIAATRFPEREPVEDPTVHPLGGTVPPQGVQLATMEALVRYWGTEYDLRRVEARLNALPQFVTEIDGLDIHFIHVRRSRARAAGDHHPRLARLGHRDAERRRPAHRPDRARRQRRGRVRRGDPVDTGLRVLRQADDERLGSRPHRQCLGRADEAPRLHALRRAGRRLGRGHRRPDGRAGASGAARHPLQHAGRPAARDRAGVRAARRSPRRRPVSRPRSSAPTSR